MVKITLNKKDVIKLIGRNVPDNILKEKIPMMGTDLDDITKKEINVEIFPNRPDMLSEEGFARALSSFLGIKTGLKKYTVLQSKYKYTYDSKVKKVRPYCTGVIIKGLKLSSEAVQSLMNLQEKLHTTHGRNRKRVAMGLHDADKIKFPLTYTTKKPTFSFTPLETPRDMTLGQILENHKKGKDYAHLLKEFKEYPIWIDSNNQVLSMPPIINSEETKVTDKTKDVFLDVTGTNRAAVDQALNILTAACVDRGGKIYQISCNTANHKDKHPNLEPQKVKINKDYLNKRLGLDLSLPQIKKLLEKMGLTLNGNTVLIPAYRADILSHVDIIEEVGIAYGYENFKEEIPNISTLGEEDKFELFKNNITNVCIGLGLTEVSNYNLANKEEVTKLMNINLKTVDLANSFSKEYNILRPWIIPSLLKVLRSNKHNEYPQNIFEIGKVFLQEGSDIKEPTRLGITICHAQADFTSARQIVESILSNFSLSGTYKEKDHPSCIPGRSARVSVKNKKLAYIGELHPQVLDNIDLDMPTVMIELNLTELYKLINF